MSEPLVSCLMPTADRRSCVSLAVETFLRQDYEPRELIVLDDGLDAIGDLLPPDPRIRYFRTARGLSLGAKRNETCRLARGDVLVHWDDDDWSTPWRVSYQVGELCAQAADVCGLDQVWFYDPAHDRAWLYRYPGGRTTWVAGGTLCYWRRVWERHRFPDVQEGEDTLWITHAFGTRVLPLASSDFYVARVHKGNSSPKQTEGLWWTSRDPAVVRTRLGCDLSRFGAAPARPAPLVSCIMPTGGRRSFVALAVECFLAQDYPRKELIVIDEGSNRVDDLMTNVPDVQYLPMSGHESTAVKRNIGCATARGDIFVQWDDDDWYGPARVSRQVARLVDGRADITALDMRWVVQLAEGECWAVSPALHRRMFFCDVHTGTLAFTRDVWTAGARYADGDHFEDVAFLTAALDRGERLLRVANDELFVYVRHDANTWRFPVGRHLDPRGWGRTPTPSAFSPALLARYQDAARDIA